MDADDQQAPAEEYEITLTGEGVTIKRPVTSDMAAAIVNLVMGGRVAAHAPPARPRVAAAQQEAPGFTGHQQTELEELSPGEYIDETEAKRNPDKIVALAHWLKTYQQQETFGRDEVRQLFEQAGEPLPKNFSRDLRWAQQVRWIQPSMEDSSRYRLTKRGIKAVEERFSSDIIKATKQPPGSRRARASNGTNGDTTNASQEEEGGDEASD